MRYKLTREAAINGNEESFNALVDHMNEQSKDGWRLVSTNTRDIVYQYDAPRITGVEYHFFWERER